MKALITMVLAGAALGGGAYWYVSSGQGTQAPAIRVDIKDLENGKVTVSWTRVKSIDGAPVTGYQVTAKPDGNDRVPPPRLVTPPAQQVPATDSKPTIISGLLEDCHQRYQVSVTPETNAPRSDPPATSPVFRPSGIVVPHRRPPFVVVLLDGIGSHQPGFRMDPYQPTAIGPESYCPQNVNNGLPIPITRGTGPDQLPNNAFLAPPDGPKVFFFKWNAWDPTDNHGGNVPKANSNSTPRDLTNGKPTYEWMLDGIAATGAMILPYSYWGATLQGHGQADPTFVFNAYTNCNSTPAPACQHDNSLDPGGYPDPAYHDYSNAVHSFSLGEDEDRLKTEIDSIENVWANEPIIIMGHSQGGLIAFETWRKYMLPGAVKHLFSLDSPINGVCAGQYIGVPPDFRLAPPVLPGTLSNPCVGPPGYPSYDGRVATNRFYIEKQDAGAAVFRFIGTLGDEVRVSAPPHEAGLYTPGYEIGTATLQHQLLVLGDNCTGTDQADCPNPPDHVSECTLPEENLVTPQNQWIYDDGHFVVKWCPGDVSYFNTVLGLSLDQAGPPEPAHAVSIMCFSGSGSPSPSEAPASCSIFGEPEDEADLIILSNMHWTGWGNSATYGTGIAQPTHPGQPGEAAVPVSVTLSDPAPRCNGKLFYTHLVAHVAGHTQTLILSGACQATPPTQSCSIPGGAEGGAALGFAASGLSCADGTRLVKAVIAAIPDYGTAEALLHVRRFVCQITPPAGYPPGSQVSPGWQVTCNKGAETLSFELPG